MQKSARRLRYEQILDEVNLALKPHFKRGNLTKDDYKEIMKNSVKKVCGFITFVV